MKYKRILLKLSGEALLGKNSYGIDNDRLVEYAEEIKQIHKEGVEIGIVIGGGNIFRGLTGSKDGIDRVQADYMGMLATVINGLALQNALENMDIPTRLQSAIKMESIAEPFIKRKATRHLEKGRVVIFASGTGNPYFTTDSAAVLRAIEINAEVILKGTRVDGIYNEDPIINTEEADDFKWIDMETLNNDIAINGQNYTVWFKIAFDYFYKYLSNEYKNKEFLLDFHIFNLYDETILDKYKKKLHNSNILLNLYLISWITEIFNIYQKNQEININENSNIKELRIPINYNRKSAGNFYDVFKSSNSRNNIITIPTYSFYALYNALNSLTQNEINLLTRHGKVKISIHLFSDEKDYNYNEVIKVLEDLKIIHIKNYKDQCDLKQQKLRKTRQQ